MKGVEKHADRQEETTNELDEVLNPLLPRVRLHDAESMLRCYRERLLLGEHRLRHLLGVCATRAGRIGRSDCSEPEICELSVLTRGETADTKRDVTQPTPTNTKETQMTATYANRIESVEIVMDGECLGLNAFAKTCVRRTADGRFAVISTMGRKLVKVLPSQERARSYNASIV